MSSRFPFFFSSKRQFKVGGAAGYSSPLSFFFANRKQKCVYFSLASCSANTRRLDAMKDRTPVWDYALHSGGLSAVRYTAVSLFFEDTDVSVFSLLCVVPSELDGDITEP